MIKFTLSQVNAELCVKLFESILMAPVQIISGFWIWLDSPLASGYCESTSLLHRQSRGECTEKRWRDVLGSNIKSLHPLGNMMSVLETKKKIVSERGRILWQSRGRKAIKTVNKCDVSTHFIMFHSWSDTCSSQDEKDLRVVSLIVPFELMLGKYSNQSQTEI